MPDCEAWDWRQPRGVLATRACLDLLDYLDEKRHGEFPVAKPKPSGKAKRRKLPLLPADLVPLSGLEIRDSEADLSSLVVRPITAEERVGWRLYVERYH